MTTDLRCPECGSTLTVVEDGKTETQVWCKDTWHVHTFVVPCEFVSCDGCEWIFTAKETA